MNGRAAPTRLVLLRLRRETERAREGHRLLRSKREALMKAFLSSLRERVRRQDLLAERCADAAAPLFGTIASEGFSSLRSAGWAAGRDLRLEVRREVIWGTRVATFPGRPLVRDFRRRGFDAAAAGHRINVLADRFEEIVALIQETASTDVRLKRLGAEIQKTSRRINALEERLIPDLVRRQKRISERLDELGRDETYRIGWLKRRRERSRGT